MGGSSGGGTQRTEPPKYQLPYLQYGVQQARSIYDNAQGPIGPSANTNTALAGIANRAGNNPLTGAQQDLATQTLNGGFLGANPYLDATFNQAAMATQGQLASQFAGSGRNVDQSQGNRAQELNALATNIYGGAYDAERNRMNQVLSMSPALQQAGYSDLNQLLGVGQTQENYAQDAADYRGNQLDQYMGRVSGNMGQTVKTDQSRNRLGGALGGAMAGSAFGPWGALLGGIGGAIF